ncbi:MAG: L,D-transpeptidase [Methylacidiphilales bacterium]|nr:L,D-transpeptidase [Candidatus Methylacidiphilales bacterium]
MNFPDSFSRVFTSNWARLGVLLLSVGLLAGCAGTSSGPYHVDAYAATVPGKVEVLVSLNAKMVYVMEDDKALLVTPCSIGTPDHPTPTGHFKVLAKDPTKRSSEYGFWVNGTNAVSGASGASPGPGYTYVGYPMANYVEFAPGYGFHEGYVWPVPRSHGCLRIHQNAIRKFYQLVMIGTPVYIAQTQPEDATIGANVAHPTDYKDPDPPASFLISPDFFKQPWDDQLIPATTQATPPPQT